MFLKPNSLEPLKAPKRIRRLVPSFVTIVEKRKGLSTPTGRIRPRSTFPTWKNRADSSTAV